MAVVSNPRILWSSFPEAPLNRYVERFWVGRAIPQHSVLIPGSGCDILFPLEIPVTLSAKTLGEVEVSGAYLVNLKNGICELFHSSESLFLSVRLRTGALRHFVRRGILTDVVDVLPMDYLWGKRILDINERISAFSTFNEMVELLSDFLLDLLQTNRKSDLWVDRANDYLYYHHSDARIGALSDNLNVSRRHLERVFRSGFGVTPKAHQQLCRLQQTIRDHLISGKNLESSALRHGYFDYSHFVKEFERILFVKLSEFNWDKLKMSHFYNYSANPNSMLFQPSKVDGLKP
jgi:AraC-like DNA-binding protein